MAPAFVMGGMTRERKRHIGNPASRSLRATPSHKSSTAGRISGRSYIAKCAIALMRKERRFSSWQEKSQATRAAPIGCPAGGRLCGRGFGCEKGSVPRGLRARHPTHTLYAYAKGLRSIDLDDPARAPIHHHTLVIHHRETETLITWDRVELNSPWPSFTDREPALSKEPRARSRKERSGRPDRYQRRSCRSADDAAHDGPDGTTHRGAHGSATDHARDGSSTEGRARRGISATILGSIKVLTIVTGPPGLAFIRARMTSALQRKPARIPGSPRPRRPFEE